MHIPAFPATHIQLQATYSGHDHVVLIFICNGNFNLMHCTMLLLAVIALGFDPNNTIHQTKHGMLSRNVTFHKVLIASLQSTVE